MKGKRENKDIDVNSLNSTLTRVVYWVFEILILGTMIASIVQLCVANNHLTRNTQVTHIMLCVVALVLYNVPSFAQKRFKLYVPSVLHIFILIFIFAHFVLGEVVGVYKSSAIFDKLLHTTSGLAIAIGGFSMVDLLNKGTNSHLKLNPFFVALFSFCFALSIALLWEIFEFAVDSIFGMNMQRWDPPEEIKKAVAAGTMKAPQQGYGLLDTMQDVIVSTVAALVVCVVGYFVLKRKKTLLNRFLLRKMDDYDTAIAEAQEAGDEKLVIALEKAKATAYDEIMADTGARQDGGIEEEGALQSQSAQTAAQEESTAQSERTDGSTESFEPERESGEQSEQVQSDETNE